MRVCRGKAVVTGESHPKCQILVLCGHTHGGGEIQMAENLRVLTGPAEYGHGSVSVVIKAGR